MRGRGEGWVPPAFGTFLGPWGLVRGSRQWPDHQPGEVLAHGSPLVPPDGVPGSAGLGAVGGEQGLGCRPGAQQQLGGFRIPPSLG